MREKPTTTTTTWQGDGCLIQSGVCSFDDRRNHRLHVSFQQGAYTEGQCCICLLHTVHSTLRLLQHHPREAPTVLVGRTFRLGRVRPCQGIPDFSPHRPGWLAFRLFELTTATATNEISTLAMKYCRGTRERIRTRYGFVGARVCDAASQGSETCLK